MQKYRIQTYFVTNIANILLPTEEERAEMRTLQANWTHWLRC